MLYVMTDGKIVVAMVTLIMETLQLEVGVGR